MIILLVRPKMEERRIPSPLPSSCSYLLPTPTSSPRSTGLGRRRTKTDVRTLLVQTKGLNMRIDPFQWCKDDTHCLDEARLWIGLRLWLWERVLSGTAGIPSLSRTHLCSWRTATHMLNVSVCPLEDYTQTHTHKHTSETIPFVKMLGKVWISCAFTTPVFGPLRNLMTGRRCHPSRQWL